MSVSFTNRTHSYYRSDTDDFARVDAFEEACFQWGFKLEKALGEKGVSSQSIYAHNVMYHLGAIRRKHGAVGKYLTCQQTEKRIQLTKRRMARRIFNGVTGGATRADQLMELTLLDVWRIESPQFDQERQRAPKKQKVS